MGQPGKSSGQAVLGCSIIGWRLTQRLKRVRHRWRCGMQIAVLPRASMDAQQHSQKGTVQSVIRFLTLGGGEGGGRTSGWGPSPGELVGVPDRQFKVQQVCQTAHYSCREGWCNGQRG